MLTGPWHAPGEDTGLLSRGMKLMEETGGDGRDEWAVTAEVQTSEQRIPSANRDVCMAPQESCSSSASCPGVMPPPLPFPPSYTVGTSAQFPPSNPLCFARFFSVLSRCFGAEVISERRQVLVAAGSSRHR